VATNSSVALPHLPKRSLRTKLFMYRHHCSIAASKCVARSVYRSERRESWRPRCPMRGSFAVTHRWPCSRYEMLAVPMCSWIPYSHGSSELHALLHLVHRLRDRLCYACWRIDVPERFTVLDLSNEGSLQSSEIEFGGALWRPGTVSIPPGSTGLRQGVSVSHGFADELPVVHGPASPYSRRGMFGRLLTTISFRGIAGLELYLPLLFGRALKLVARRRHRRATLEHCSRAGFDGAAGHPATWRLSWI